jgi:hypothetical protein
MTKSQSKKEHKKLGRFTIMITKKQWSWIMGKACYWAEISDEPLIKNVQKNPELLYKKFKLMRVVCLNLPIRKKK